MELSELKQRLEGTENLHTEFKRWPLHPESLAAAVIAFANTDGGQLLLGVNDKAEVEGFEREELDSVCQFVDNVAFNNCEPPVSVVLETLQDEAGRWVVIVNVPKGDQRPYRTKRGLYYVRTSSGRRQASREELLRLFQASESLFFDETPLFRSDMAVLDEGTTGRLLEDIQGQGFDIAGISRERLLHNLNLLKRVNGVEHPTLAGALFLAREPQKIIPYAYISALRIPGGDISFEPSDQKRIEGPLVDLLQDVMRFLNLHLLRPHRIRGLEPEALPELPVEVLREGLVNGLAHRDYTITAPIRVLVFDDRVEIRTPGKLPNTVTIDSLRLGVHVLRNPTIYNLFLKIGLVTDTGSGIPRIIRLVREATGKEVGFAQTDNEFIVTLPRANDRE